MDKYENKERIYLEKKKERKKERNKYYFVIRVLLYNADLAISVWFNIFGCLLGFRWFDWRVHVKRKVI